MYCIQCLLLLLIATGISCFLNIEELQSIDYGIDILDKPLVAGETSPDGSILVSSKYGQTYQCAYPDKSGEDKKEKEDEKIALETGIPDLLRPMEESPCLIHTSGWWSYEFCYGKHVRQYHMEEGKISGATIYIGYYESEFDWNSDSEAQTKAKKSRLNRYHSQKYVNGSTCDLTNKPRKAEVRFMCEDGSGDYVTRVDEPETCSYIITVHTTKICHHPYLKPPSKNRPVPITCNPLLSQEDFNEYMKDQEEAAALEEERKLKAQEEQSKSKENEVDMQKLLSETLVKNLKNKFAEDDVDLDDIGIKVIKDPDDIKSMLRDAMKKGENSRKKPLSIDEQIADYELQITSYKQDIAEADIAMNTFPDDEAVQTKFSQKKAKAKESLEDYENRLHELINAKKKHDSLQSQTLKATLGGMEGDSEEELSEIKEVEGEEDDYKDDDANDMPEDDTDDEIMREFDHGYKEIADTEQKKARLAKYKDNIESAMQAQFSDIVEEATNELNKEGVDAEVDKDEAMEQLTQTLGKLLKRLEKTENDIKSIDEQLAKTEDTEANLDTDKKDSDIEIEDETESAGQGQVKATESNNDLKFSSSKESNKPEAQVKNTDTQSNLKSDKDTLSDRVKVKVKQVKKGAPLPQKDDNTLKLGEAHKDKLEKTVKNQLEKAGVDTGGRKIEVRIITAGYYDTDEGSMHTLSEEETQSFNKMIVAVLGQNDDEMKEIQRHDKLESNYEFNWDKNKRTKEKRNNGYS